jgi:hypothetical protein
MTAIPWVMVLVSANDASVSTGLRQDAVVTIKKFDNTSKNRVQIKL